jgi:hypothetical protein
MLFVSQKFLLLGGAKKTKNMRILLPTFSVTLQQQRAYTECKVEAGST